MTHQNSHASATQEQLAACSSLSAKSQNKASKEKSKHRFLGIFKKPRRGSRVDVEIQRINYLEAPKTEELIEVQRPPAFDDPRRPEGILNKEDYFFSVGESLASLASEDLGDWKGFPTPSGRRPDAGLNQIQHKIKSVEDRRSLPADTSTVDLLGFDQTFSRTEDLFSKSFTAIGENVKPWSESLLHLTFNPSFVRDRVKSFLFPKAEVSIYFDAFYCNF